MSNSKYGGFFNQYNVRDEIIIFVGFILKHNLVYVKISIMTILFLFLLNSCEEGKEKYEYYKFRKQITPSGKYIIYDYARYGAMAFSSDISGTVVFKANEIFEEGKGQQIDGAICAWLSNDTLLVYNFKSNLEQPKDTFPIKIEIRKLGDFIVKTVFMKANSGGRDSYDFDSIRITNNSIFIRIVENKKRKYFLKFPLGATTIKTKGDSITHIEVSTILNKNMDFVYKNTDGTFSTGLAEVGTTEYDLTPIKKISANGLYKRKIFWEE